MPLVIFWLVPVILVVILVVLLLSNKPKIKPELFLVEPLLFLIDKWDIARIEGDKKTVNKLLSYWLPGLEMQHSPVEQIARQIRSNPPIIPNKKVIILNQKKLPFWAEQRVVELNGKQSSVFMGSVTEVLEYCDAYKNKKITKEDIGLLFETANKAYKNGFWVLAVAQASSDKALETRKYKLEGLVILEPNINDKARGKLHFLNAQAPVKFLSYLPGAFVESLVEKVFPSRKDYSINGFELKNLPPKEQEVAVKEKTIFAEIAKNNRYYVTKHLALDNQLTLVSRVSSDEDLPADNKI